jgi:hypothetical protein
VTFSLLAARVISRWLQVYEFTFVPDLSAGATTEPRSSVRE